MSEQASNPPIKKFRVGDVSADVWERVTDAGTFHDVSFSRSFKDKQGQWKSAGNFSAADIGSLRLCLNMAEKFLIEKLMEAQA